MLALLSLSRPFRAWPSPPHMRVGLALASLISASGGCEPVGEGQREGVHEGVHESVHEGADAAPVTSVQGGVTLDAAAPVPSIAPQAGPDATSAALAGGNADSGLALGDPTAPDGSLEAGAPDSAQAEARDAALTDSASASLPEAAVDAALPFAPLAVSDQPLQAKNGAWTYLEFPDTACRDGSRAGIALSPRQPSKKLLIFLEGGAYCFHPLLCLFNPSGVDDLVFNSAKSEPTQGIFDRKNVNNPVRDWNIVYVPYCTGDGHGGSKTTPTDVPEGPKGQLFGGQLNLEKFLRRVVPTFKDATDVVLTGISAGGFGVLQSLVLVQRAFPWLKVRHVNDSGPALANSAIPACLQDKMRLLWGLDASSLSSCGTSCPNRSDYLQDNSLFLAQVFADRAAGFIGSEEDEMMRTLFGTGLNNCTGSPLFDSVPAETYRSALRTYRDKLKAFPSYGSFIAKGGQHTWLRDNSFYTEQANGTKLVDWFAKIVNGEAPAHVGL